METFAIFLNHIPGAELNPSVIQEHIDHLRKLDEAGALVLCGPFTDHPSGLVVVQAENKKSAIAIAESDPFVQKQVRSFEVHTWLLANRENNYLG